MWARAHEYWVEINAGQRIRLDGKLGVKLGIKRKAWQWRAVTKVADVHSKAEARRGAGKEKDSSEKLKRRGTEQKRRNYRLKERKAARRK